MSKQRGKGFHGGRRKYPHKDDCDLKQHDNDEQHKIEKFLRDMQCALGVTFYLYRFMLFDTESLLFVFLKANNLGYPESLKVLKLLEFKSCKLKALKVLENEGGP